jgi:Enoyl-CoA hydratase/isomerase
MHNDSAVLPFTAYTHRAGGGADAKVHEHVARAKTGHCAGARLVRWRRQRHRTVHRSCHCQRRRADRNAVIADVGMLPERAMAYRLGLTKVKEYALTGKPLSGREAADVGLINWAVPFDELEGTVRRWTQQLASIPSSQLAAMKLIVNQTCENMGLNSTQILGPILDGLMRNTPDAIDFIRRAEQEGVRPAITARDGPFRDYSQADANERPNPNHFISI